MDNKEKKVQIPYKTFISLIKLTGELLTSNPEINFAEVETINNELLKKLDAMQKRNLYTTYKTSSNEKEKEEARQKYIKFANIHKDFKY